MLSFFGNNVAVVMSPYQDYCLQSCSGIFFFELRNSSAEAREGVGIREDFLPRIKIQYMFFFFCGKGIHHLSQKRYSWKSGKGKNVTFVLEPWETKGSRAHCFQPGKHKYFQVR